VLHHIAKGDNFETMNFLCLLLITPCILDEHYAKRMLEERYHNEAPSFLAELMLIPEFREMFNVERLEKIKQLKSLKHQLHYFSK
jgi:hypothetical protein